MNEDPDTADSRAPDTGENARTMNDDTTLDLLLVRILDRRAAPADWDAFATLAQSRPDSWPQLLSALRSEQGLLRGAEVDLAVADRVELPAASAPAVSGVAELATTAGAEDRAAAPVTSLAAARARRSWTGWAAAAVLALAWTGSSMLPQRGGMADPTLPATPGGAGGPVAQASPDPSTTAPQGPGAGSAEAPDTRFPQASPAAVPGAMPLLAQSGGAPGPRLRDPSDTSPAADDERGDIVGELPLQLVSSAAAPDGKGVDVLYVRPVLERARVSGMYSLGVDDAGRPAPVNIRVANLLKSGSN